DVPGVPLAHRAERRPPGTARAPGSRRGRATPRCHRLLVARVDRPAPTRWSMARPPDPKRPRPEAPRAVADGCRRRSTDDVPARGDPWRAQLGLPVPMAAGLGLRDGSVPRSGLRGRGRGVLLVADASIAGD